MTVATLADPALVEHANAIRGLGKRVVADVIEIGRRLADCKELCGHGNWLPWLKREFGWSEDTAERFIQVSTLSHQIPQVAEFNLPVSSLYLLAAPSTHDEARESIIARAQAGEALPIAEVKRVIADKRARQQAKAERRAQREDGRSRALPPTAELRIFAGDRIRRYAADLVALELDVILVSIGQVNRAASGQAYAISERSDDDGRPNDSGTMARDQKGSWAPDRSRDC
jgi:Protein of unknown function (DUF3102)